MPVSARSYSVDKDDFVCDLLASADPTVIARLDNLQNQARDRHNAIVGAAAEAEDLRLQRDDLKIRKDRLEHDIERSGKEVRKRTINPDTGQEEWVIDPVLVRFQTQIDAINKRMNNMAKNKWPRDWHDFLQEYLRALPAGVELISYERPIPAAPAPTEDAKDVFLRDDAMLNMLREELSRTWESPRPKEEIRERTHNTIKALAKNSEPRLGGLALGSSEDHRGNLQVATPRSRIGWPKENHGFFATPGGNGAKLLETLNGVGLVCWLFQDELLAKLDKVIEDRFPDAGIPAAAKPALIRDLENKIWEQRKLVEESFLAAEATGAKGIKRPHDTPPEILLGIEKIGSRRPAVIDPVDETAGTDLEFG